MSVYIQGKQHGYKRQERRSYVLFASDMQPGGSVPLSS